jgi:hypothetical protein
MPGGGRRWKTLVSQLREFGLDIEFPTVAHRPWKSPKARFPHFHRAGDVSGFLFPIQTLAPAGLACQISGPWQDKAAPDPPRLQCASAREESLIPDRLD